jgi:hypothetical protein
VPKQLLVRAPKARNRKTDLAHGTSVFETRASIPADGEGTIIDGLRLFSLPAALVSSGPALFSRNPTEARTAALPAVAPDTAAVPIHDPDDEGDWRLKV